MRLTPVEFPQAGTCFISLVLAWSLTQLARANDDCQLREVPVSITHEVQTARRGVPVSLTCVKTVMLKKCEGLCESSLTPSVKVHPGFNATCRCCKESDSRTRFVVLDECFDGNQLFPGEEHAVPVMEILSCECNSCNG